VFDLAARVRCGMLITLMVHLLCCCRRAIT
jgi:hypothetical protein